MLGRICQGLSGAFIMPASLALIKTYWDGAGRQRAVSLWSMGSWGGSGFAALFGGLMAQNVGWRWIFFASAGGVAPRDADGPRHPGEQGRRSGRAIRFDTKGVLTFMVTMVALQVLTTQGSQIGWTNPITLGLAAIAVVGRGHVLQGRVGSAISVRELRALSQRDVHGSDDLELPVERRCRDAAGVDDAGADRWWPVGTGGRDADARLRDCHRGLHPRGREAAAEVRRAQADDLGQPDRRPLGRYC